MVGVMPSSLQRCTHRWELIFSRYLAYASNFQQTLTCFFCCISDWLWQELESFLLVNGNHTELLLNSVWLPFTNRKPPAVAIWVQPSVCLRSLYQMDIVNTHSIPPLFCIVFPLPLLLLGSAVFMIVQNTLRCLRIKKQTKKNDINQADQKNNATFEAAGQK